MIMKKAKKILIIAGDPSGDLHAANLVREILKREPDTDIAAVGGPHLAQAGANLIGDLVSEAVVGFSEVISHLPNILKLYATALTAAKRADLVIFVDYPGFNLALARKIHTLTPRPKMLYYIAPQVWAWHKSRKDLMNRIMDKIAVVFPFEADVFGAEHAEFVGHPLLDLPAPEPDPEFSNSRVVALLPGSRKNEVARHFSVLSDVASLLIKKGFRPVISMADPTQLSRFHSAPCELYSGDVRRLLASAECAVIKSGTGTLEAALIGTPLVAIYRLSWTSYWIGKMLVDIERIAMPNILLNRTVIPELIQSAAAPEKIVEELLRIDLPAMKREFSQLRDLLRNHGSAARTAQIALEM